VIEALSMSMCPPQINRHVNMEPRAKSTPPPHGKLGPARNMKGKLTRWRPRHRLRFPRNDQSAKCRNHDDDLRTRPHRMSAENLIELHGLTKTYGSGDAAFKALAGIDLTIRRSEFVAVMGPSGSGKSTLMNILGCLDSPSSGSYRFKGIKVETLNKDQRSLIRRHALGFIFQGFNLLARTSALENVELPLLYRGYSRKQRHQMAREALASVGIADKERNTPSELSGGQQQRVAIARAIVTQPDTLFADEPTGNLDSKTTLEIMELLRHLNTDRGISIIMVTHETDVAAYAKRTIRVMDGLISDDQSSGH
jgi:putative ABC transport system ATP-binding protein